MLIIILNRRVQRKIPANLIRKYTCAYLLARVCLSLRVCVCERDAVAGRRKMKERGEASKMAAGHECVWLIQRQAISPRWHNWKLEMKKEERGREKRFNQEFKVQRQPYWVKSISKSLGNAISPAMLMGWKPEKAHFSRVARRCFFYSFFFILDSYWVAILKFHAA